MKFAGGSALLMSVLCGACGGDEHAPALADLDNQAQLDRRNPGLGGAGGDGDSGGGGDGASIPTSMEAEPNPTSSGQAGQGGATATLPTACSRGIWTGNFDARSQADLLGLRDYTEVSGDLYVGTSSSSSATDVSSLSALSCLRSVGGMFTILESPLLHDLQGLEALEDAARFTVSTNAGIETLEGLTGLVVSGTVHIRANAQLTSLGTGIIGAGDVVISNNPQLSQCDAEDFAAALGVPCSYCTGNLDSCP